MNDPVADLLTRIRNGQQARHESITLDSSKLKEEIVKVLKQEGYILDYSISTEESSPAKKMTVTLKYFKNLPVIDKIKRISRPGLRVYKSYKEFLPVPGFGIAIVSTSKGVMTHIQAKKLNVGGEVLCEVA